MQLAEPRPVRHQVQRLELRVNWGAVVEDLQCSGLSLRRIGELVDVAESTLRACRYGDMGHSKGERLITLWMQHTGHEREAIPLWDGLGCEP